MPLLRIAVLSVFAIAGCSGRRDLLPPDAGLTRDASGLDAATADAFVAPHADANVRDASSAVDGFAVDAFTADAFAADAFTARDTGTDAARADSGSACVLGTVECTGGYTADSYVGVCAAHELHVLGVYEPSSGRTRIPVSVTRTGAALTIVVSSYEAVSWDFTLAPGVNVERVILNGFSTQTTTGLPASVVVTDRSGGSAFAACAYEWPVGTGGCATEALISGVETLTGLATTSFTGCYQASSFAVVDP